MPKRMEGGYAIITGPDGVQECSTYTCGHCNTVHRIEPGQRAEDLGGLCKMCMKLICCTCVETGKCEPFEKKLEAMEASYHARRSYG